MEEYNLLFIMRIFKKTTHSFIKDLSLYELIKNFNDNVDSIKSISFPRIKVNQKKFQGALAKDYFIVQEKKDLNHSFGNDYEGKIKKYGDSYKITIVASTPIQIRAVFWIMAVVGALIFIPMFISNIINSLTFMVVFILAMVGLIYVFNSIRSNIDFTPLEKLFDEHY